MNNHYEPLLVIKYLKLDTQFPSELSPIFQHEETFFTAESDEPSSPNSGDEGERGGSNSGLSLKSISQKPCIDSHLQAKFNLLKKTESFARLEKNIVEKSEDKIAEYKRAAQFYTPYVENHWELMRLYSVMRRAFRDDLITLTEEERNSSAFLQRVVDLLILASILKGVHRHGLNVPRTTRMYLRDQKLLNDYLKDVAGLHTGIDPWETEPPTPALGTQTVRDFQLQWNLFRLFWVRLRRFIGLLALYWQGDFLQGFRDVELKGTLYIFTYLAWIFFLPRLLVNLGLIYKHVFDESAMTEVEKHLGWRVRLRAQLVRRWQELANDAAWFSSGITTCFFLANQIPAVGLYLAVAMQSYDLFITTTRFTIEYRRLRKLKKALEACDSSENRSKLLADMDKRMTFDLIELIYNWVNFLILLVCAILMTQFFAGISPLVPIVASLTTVAVTLLTYCVTRYIMYQRQKLYDGQLIAPDVRCVKEVNDASEKIDIKKIDLGIFAVGYLRIIDSKGNLANIIYVNKQTEQMVDFSKAFCWDKSRALFQLEPDEISELKNLLGQNGTPSHQEIKHRIDMAENAKGLIFSPEETALIMEVCAKSTFSQKIDSSPAYKITDLDSSLPKSNKFQVILKEQQDVLLGKLQNMQHDVSKLKNAEKMPFWRTFTKQTSKSVYAFSGALLGTGGG